MSSIERLKELSEEAIRFHNAYVKSFTPFLSEAKFNKFRLYFLNLIQDDLDEFFNTSHQLQLVINTMHVGLKVWANIAKVHQVPNEVFNFFFIASCLIVLKLESPEKVKRLKNWACNINMNIDFVLWAERLILNQASWDLYLNTPSEYAAIVLDEFIIQHLHEDHFDSLKELISTWIQFGLNEYSLYYKYDQVTLTLASIYIGLSQHDNVSKDTFKKFISFLEHNEIIDLNHIQQCSNSFMLTLESYNSTNEEEEDLSELISLTRANSSESYSLDEVFAHYDQTSLIDMSQRGNWIQSSILGDIDDDSMNISSNINHEFLSKKRKASASS